MLEILIIETEQLPTYDLTWGTRKIKGCYSL